jgi:hypothetical protein
VWVRFFRAVCGGAAILVLTFTARTAAADDLSYTGLDDATVRVFALEGVGLERVRSAKGKPYVLASPNMVHGTGLLVSRDGVILTARHVVKDAHLLAVQFPGEDQAVPATVAYTDAEHDHAFLVVSGNHKGFVPIPDHKPKLAVRQTVYVIGYPLDATRTHPQSQQGIVSGVLPGGDLQLGVALNPGNSGGPVVDASEHLVGIAVARADPKAGAQGIGVAISLEPILASYGKIRSGNDLKDAQKELTKNKKRLTAEANLLAGLITADDANAAWEALSGKKDAPASSSTIDGLVDTAMKSADTPSPDVMTLAAAQAWNAAAVSIERGDSPKSNMTRVRQLVARAKNADSDVATRSPFVSFALDDHDPTDNAAGIPSGDQSEDSSSNVSSGNDSSLDTLLNSLETKKAVPMVRAGPALGFLAPYQLFGIGAVGKFLFAETVSVTARYQYGWHAMHADTTGSHFFEALGGVALGTWHSHTTAQLVVDVEHSPFATIYHYVPGEVPSVHVLIGEVGVQSGLLNLESRSPTGITNALVHQSFFFEAGVRYIYFYHANSDYLLRAARSNFEASAHLLAPPFGIPKGSLNADGKNISSVPGFDLDISWDSVLSIGQTEIGGGYFPSGNWIYAHIGWAYLFY